jgi:hypothetical protein
VSCKNIFNNNYKFGDENVSNIDILEKIIDKKQKINRFIKISMKGGKGSRNQDKKRALF